jgi:hypothetical protein
VQQQQQQQPAGGQQQQAQLVGQPIQINANGSLKGNASTPFDGTRAKSAGFLLTFNLFRAANRHNDAMANPFSHITTALTYMTGDAMEACVMILAPQFFFFNHHLSHLHQL